MRFHLPAWQHPWRWGLFGTFIVAILLSLTCECVYVCIAQVDSKLSSFVTALSEVSSMTDPIYGPDSTVGESEISSLTSSQCGKSRAPAAVLHKSVKNSAD